MTTGSGGGAAADLVADLRRSLAAVADPGRAPAMQSYMKSAMPYLGVPAPVARKVFSTVFAAHPLPDRDTWTATVRAVWAGATHREERYGAIALTGHRFYRAHQDPGTLPLYRELIVDGAWWDYVDELASRRVGPILRRRPDQVRPVLLGWSTGPDLWLRRTSVIAQLGAKQDTDLDLLTACIEANLDERDFFLRKAIGWALRQYAWTDPRWVQQYVASHADRLSPLSRREALKNIGPAA